VIRPARNQWDNTGEVRTMKSAQLAVCCCIFLGIAIFTGSYARSSQSITTARAATVDQQVHQLMRSVAHDVTQQGPLAWLKYFEAGSSFFMVVDGQMAFADGTAAREGTQSFSRTIQHIELQWGICASIHSRPSSRLWALPGAKLRLTTRGIARRTWVFLPRWPSFATGAGNCAMLTGRRLPHLRPRTN
jgi:hypothetical protein